MRNWIWIFNLCFCSLLSAADVSPLLERVDRVLAQGRIEEARDTLLRAARITDQPEQRDLLLTQVGDLNMDLLLSRVPTRNSELVMVNPGDTLDKLARRHGSTIELLRHINRLEGDMLRAGRRIKVPKGRFSVHVDKGDNRLELRLNGEYFKQYRVATGKGGNTPVGQFTIVNRIVHPEWWHPDGGAAIPYGDPRHKIGSHWLGWDQKGFGIHGTDEPESIGNPVSLGCVRLVNEEVAELYEMLPIGTRVFVQE